MPRERRSLAHTRHARRGRGIFLWEDVELQWPRRLLHIPSMTSVERRDGNTYGPFDEKEPGYSILTYTWGRWPAPGGPHIPVAGTTWAIPAVDEAKFTVASFEEVIKKMGQTYDFAWIDVVCIDQENYDVKMDEIGRQVGIFANASQVYVWIWSLPTARLQHVYDDITRCGASLDNSDGLFRQLPPLATSSLMYDDSAPRNVSQKGDELTHIWIPQATLSSLEASIGTLLGDPWFSSLWTLQEGLLRQDAIFLSQEAECVQHRIGIVSPEAEMFSLIRAFSNIQSSLELYDGPCTESSYGNLVDSVVGAIRQSGFPTRNIATNPNIQWAAAQYRNATNAEDRVYGILALYNIQVGDTVPNNANRKKPSLRELETDFAVTLNAKSPLLGQLFVHAGPARPRGKSWQISGDIIVPYGFTYWDEDNFSNYSSIVGLSTGLAEVEGDMCLLKDLRHFWNASLKRFKSYKFSIVLDEYIVHEHPTIIASRPTRKSRTTEDVHGGMLILIDSALEEFQEDAVSVLELGGTPKEIFGLVLVHPPNDRSLTNRIGICKWERLSDTDMFATTRAAGDIVPLLNRDAIALLYKPQTRAKAASVCWSLVDCFLKSNQTLLYTLSRYKGQVNFKEAEKTAGLIFFNCCCAAVCPKPSIPSAEWFAPESGNTYSSDAADSLRLGFFVTQLLPLCKEELYSSRSDEFLKRPAPRKPSAFPESRLPELRPFS
ncbi:hypothetical protein FHL15_009150 [Xylaria flabelliformis]|uniref:Heterokaryon incompatibility domain-containing protein n=1 Tax=Xylaria flabelliformis TaxID=2512241 RepID=A0A553HPJ3_9PEZI|nr:hypothetical protein FHL15_009150 [Xylaria flabelliformis]